MSVETPNFNRSHSDFLHIFFPIQRDVGIDCGTVELKEMSNAHHKFTIYPKDYAAKHIVFYDHIDQLWLICNTLELPKIRAKRSISTQQLKKLCYFISSDCLALLNEAIEILPKKYR